jgi:hypothetical protein
MNDAIVWLIIAVFYAPLHFGGPLGVSIIIEQDADRRRRMVRYMLVDCSLSMLVAFGLVIWLATDNLGAAMAILFLSMLVPYLLLYLHHRLIVAASEVS